MNPQRAKGVSLVELLVALAIAGTVLATVAGLLTLGLRRLREGGRRGQASAVARMILEDLDSRDFRRLWADFGVDGSAPAYRFDSRVEPAASRWQRALDRSLGAGHAEIFVEPAGRPAPPNVREAPVLRVRVIVSWQDDGRLRRLALVTVRT